ncbi:hypothetical protein [Hymenobacter armeniacus]|uniref:Uncharacterized protein n=1 Tax=Hymenobacter armeniacus TaxID=2771358 RepID=A0ABR8K070_9BACT|nr:hypothetical protein [Hymenobacter armeniacus]MBD2723519.1 hypothetical protein [Hymenobacter armeniacus]
MHRCPAIGTINPVAKVQEKGNREEHIGFFRPAFPEDYGRQEDAEKVHKQQEAGQHHPEEDGIIIEVLPPMFTVVQLVC